MTLGLSSFHFFFPAQFLTFRYLPVELRVLAVNAMDAVWMCAVSLQVCNIDPCKNYCQFYL